MSPCKQARDERLTSDVFALPGCAGMNGRSTVADLLRLLGDEPGDSRAAESIPVLMRQLHAGHTLFHEGARAESIYVVCTGHFKSQRIAEDGAEHVLGFAGRAELLGFDALCVGAHPTSAVALEDATVYAVPVRDLSALGQRIAGFDRALHFALSRQLSRRDEQIALMAPMAAEVRMARFLMQQSLHMAARGQSPRLFHLPMGRRDIARYLGIAHETVSRSFGSSSLRECVRVENRAIAILDIDRLAALACNTCQPAGMPHRTQRPRPQAVAPEATVRAAAAEGRWLRCVA